MKRKNESSTVFFFLTLILILHSCSYRPTMEGSTPSPRAVTVLPSSSSGKPTKRPSRIPSTKNKDDSSSLSSASSTSGKKLLSKNKNSIVMHPSVLGNNYVDVSPGSSLPSSTSASLSSNTNNNVSSWISYYDYNASIPYSLTIQISFGNILSILILLGMACLGGYYLYRLSTRKRCNCPLCDTTYVIKEKLGTGGFGSVYTVEKKSSSLSSTLTVSAGKAHKSTLSTRKSSNSTYPLTKGNKNLFVLKQIYVEDVKEANEAMKEARELRYLTHPRIVQYYEDFLHYAYPSYFSSEIYQALYVCIIMEQCTGGDLKQRISKIRKQKVTVSPSLYNTVINTATEITLSSLGVPSNSTVNNNANNNVHNSNLGPSTIPTPLVVSSNPPSLSTPTTVLKISSQHHIPEYLIIRWTTQIAMALKYCHSKGVCHRDIKSQNIFITENDDVRIGDFGLAKSFHKHKPVTLLSDAGTDCYKSPETFLGGKRDARKADIWAVGLVLLELTTNVFTWERKEGCLGARVLPFINNNNNNPTPTATNGNNHRTTTTGGIPSSMNVPTIIENLLSTIPTDIYSSQLRLLIKRCLIPDPDLRPSAEELFRFKLLRYNSSSSTMIPSSSQTNSSTSANYNSTNPLLLTSSSVGNARTIPNTANTSNLNPPTGSNILFSPSTSVTTTVLPVGNSPSISIVAATTSPPTKPQVTVPNGTHVRIPSFPIHKSVIGTTVRIPYSSSSDHSSGSSSSSSQYDSEPSDEDSHRGGTNRFGRFAKTTSNDTDPYVGDAANGYDNNNDDDGEEINGEYSQWKSVHNTRFPKHNRSKNNQAIHPQLQSSLNFVQTDASYATTDKDESLPPIRNRSTQNNPNLPSNPFMVLASDSPKARNKQQARHRVRQQRK